MSPRKQALANKDKTYIGKPCKHGHASGLRMTRNSECIECLKNLNKYDRPRNLLQKQAKDKNETTYMGEPCLHGHSGERYSTRDVCVECARISNKKYGKIKQAQNEDKRRKENDAVLAYLKKNPKPVQY